MKGQSLKHWTTKEVPYSSLLIFGFMVWFDISVWNQILHLFSSPSPLIPTKVLPYELPLSPIYLQFLYLFHLLIQTRWTHGFLLNSIDYDPFFYNIWIHTWPQIWSVGFPSSWLLWPFETSPWFLECFLTFWQYQNIPVDLIFSCPYQGVSHLSKNCVFF